MQLLQLFLCVCVCGEPVVVALVDVHHHRIDSLTPEQKTGSRWRTDETLWIECAPCRRRRRRRRRVYSNECSPPPPPPPFLSIPLEKNFTAPLCVCLIRLSFHSLLFSQDKFDAASEKKGGRGEWNAKLQLRLKHDVTEGDLKWKKENPLLLDVWVKLTATAVTKLVIRFPIEFRIGIVHTSCARVCGGPPQLFTWYLAGII